MWCSAVTRLSLRYGLSRLICTMGILVSLCMVLMAVEYKVFVTHFEQTILYTKQSLYRENTPGTHSIERGRVERFPRTVSLENKTVFMYSAIARNNSKTGSWGVIAVNSWQPKQLENHTFICCLKFNHDTILKVPVRIRNNFPNSKICIKQYVCPIPKHSNRVLPTGISLASTNRHCPRNPTKYIRPVYPKTRGNLAVCTKFAFGTLSAASIIEWFEFHKLMGVDKVVTFTYKLNPDAMKVLRYYARNGPGEVHAVRDTGDYKLTVGLKNYQAFTDEQATVFDCQARLAGYKYIGVFDFDEYLTPKQHKNWKDMMAFIRQQWPRASAFRLLTETYVTSWGALNKATDLIMEKYLNRTVAKIDHVKLMVISDMIKPGSLHTHTSRSQKPYKRMELPEEVASIKHYRACRREWLKGESGHRPCYDEMERITDTSMLPIAAMIKDEVTRVKTLLGIAH